MRFAFKELPGTDGAYLRPVVGVRVDRQEFELAALLDTGSLHNRFGGWVAQALGLDLTQGEPGELAVGGVLTRAVSMSVDLAIADMKWRAPVSFCEPWPYGFQLLGQEGCFRFFRAVISASRYRFELEPDPGDAS